jgi:HlyD family secretion protein
MSTPVAPPVVATPITNTPPPATVPAVPAVTPRAAAGATGAKSKAPPGHWQDRARLPLGVGTVVVLAIGGALLWRQFHKPVVVETVSTEAAALHDISQSVDATGTVQAIEVVEIKSKASGEVTRMPVSIGSVVKTGDLLAQIDPLTVRNQYNQLLAALRAAQSNVSISTAARARADALYSREAMTAADHEAAQLGAANAQASVAKASADLQIARQALDDATVRAPSAGTIVEQTATRGMVITSATSGASGGTTLF